MSRRDDPRDPPHNPGEHSQRLREHSRERPVTFAHKKRMLRDSASVFRTLIDRSRDAVFITDPDTGRFLYVNQEACRSLGYSETELISMGVSDIEQTIRDDSSLRQHLQELGTTGRAVVQGVHRRKDGSTFPVEVSLRTVALDGIDGIDGLDGLDGLDGSELMVAVARDASVRQNEESIRADYRDFIEKLVRERSVALEQANAALAQEVASRKEIQQELAERLEREQLIAKTLERFVASDLDHALGQTLADLGTLSGAHRAYLFRFSEDRERMSNTHEWCAPGVAPERENLQDLPVSTFPWWTARMMDGAPLAIEDLDRLPAEAAAERELLAAQQIQSLLAFPFLLDEQPGGFIGLDNVRQAGTWSERELTYLKITAEIIRHVLQRAETEQRLERQLRQAQKMDALGRLAGGVAHDFNNLLVLINNYASFLLQALDEGDPRQEDAAEILKAGERAGTLTKQLLAFSGKLKMDPHTPKYEDPVTRSQVQISENVSHRGWPAGAAGPGCGDVRSLLLLLSSDRGEPSCPRCPETASLTGSRGARESARVLR